MLSEHAHDDDHTVEPLYGRRAMTSPIPRYSIPEQSMEPRAAYELIHGELELDGNPMLNLASFVTTWMDPEARMLMSDTMSKNFIDADEYPRTAEIERRCVSIIAGLFHAEATGEQAVGTSTVGSSEAIHLCGLALKRNWQKRQAAAGKPTDRPNIVMGANVQVVWEKFVRYFEVEPRYVKMAPGRSVIGVDEAMAQVDENTIAVVGILGSTYTGEFEPVKALNDALVVLNERNGWSVPLHVDAASGGFVAPFAYPDLEWDFRVPLVRSINASGHKYGLVYPGVGWAIWRDKSDLPDDLLFHDSYLGGDQITFDLNFSKPSSQVIGQYFNLIRLGREGYTAIMEGLLSISEYLASEVEGKYFELCSKPGSLPVVCLKLKGDAPFTCHDVSDHLRMRGWIVPAYTLPADLDDVHVLRVVVREGFTRDMADALVADALAAVEELTAHPPETPKVRPGATQKHVC